MNPTEAVKTCLAGRIRIQTKKLGFVFIRMNVQLGANRGRRKKHA